MRYRIVKEDLHRDYDGSIDPATIDQVLAEEIAAAERDATVDTYLPITVERAARERLSALGEARPEILYASKNNAARAQLAYAITKHLAGDRVYVRTIGTESNNDVDPQVVAELERRGIDASALYTKDDVARTVHTADVVVLLGVSETPSLPGHRYETWDIRHPRDEVEISRAADFIEQKVRDLLVAQGLDRI
ncbi:putative arsenate reductase [Corynebacterium renale]|uniref:Protein-tyrosine-phosphatase n=1 Tax=Corynebacterium renale TaxID=1724 RepID=A0A2A9DN98_9CORY|nr:protein-tyrosine-phosphatase [Corynebacterium renale]PFG27380.1 protein-tyrosine-phosphatase [Corynebacterium renale]SQG63884.1 putative arsenate reductase [Corynebacterium renale]SQI23533.1 putative arsenate reductase [Corynebacterium renale]STD02654.1 putative arsenate reductase [Corynebacterium renale]